MKSSAPRRRHYGEMVGVAPPSTRNVVPVTLRLTSVGRPNYTSNEELGVANSLSSIGPYAMKPIEKITIIGLGTLGAQIAIQAAAYGYDVDGFDPDSGAFARMQIKVRDAMRMVRKGLRFLSSNGSSMHARSGFTIILPAPSARRTSSSKSFRKNWKPNAGFSLNLIGSLRDRRCLQPTALRYRFQELRVRRGVRRTALISTFTSLLWA